MKTILTRFVLAATLVVAAFSPAFAQTALNFTTFSAAITDPAGRTATVASTTGIVAPTTSAVTYLYADGELMQVLSVNTTTKLVGIIRGVGGTRAVTHPANGFVYVTTPDAVITYDPTGNCTPSANTSLPLLNVRNGNIWHCQTTTSGSAWMGFNTGPMMEIKPRTVVAGTAYTILPTDYIIALSTTLTGSGGVGVAVKSFTLPSHVGLAGKQIVIKDESGGIGATTKIILVGTIDGTNSASATVVQLVTPFGAVGLEAGSGGWFTIWCHGGNGSTTCR